ncbi:hypothetical protein [Blastococcus sp. CCUG 61487]|uniref:hypothetical protein n=1 Tax=Blastococcus sp. CCUG 61487 TaxID=1840703 RepID=UPI0014853645|nr:hypothetical protein [Blastococcus sp. CCUG 61487]
MTAERVGRFVLAPVVGGVAAWDAGTALVLAPVRLSAPVPVALPYRKRWVTGSRP